MSLTWLHISDFHIRSGDPYDRDVVLRAMVRSVADHRAKGRAPDVIFATGDVAHSGRAAEYELAGKFFDDLLGAANLEKKRLFVIPGNHDVDRDLGVGLARTLESREQSDTYFHPDLPKPHLTQKFRAFQGWYNKYFSGVRVALDHTTCGPVELLVVKGRRLGIVPINTALFCQGDDDHGKLWVGRRCLDGALSDLRELDSEINIALVHHPLDWLCGAEGSNIQTELEASIHILLRGHLHETRVESVASAEGETLRCAAGAAYQSRKWPNRALYGTLHGDQLTIYPVRYEDSPQEIWTIDPSVFPREEHRQYEKTFQVPRLSFNKNEPSLLPASLPAAPHFRSNIGSRGNLPFVGRDDLIAFIAKTLKDPMSENVVVVHGQPGVGKSELAREFARLNRDRYSGGTFLIDASTDSIAINLASIGMNILNLPLRPDLPLNDQGQQTFYTLGAARVLLIYDNVRSLERLQPWLPVSGMQCHVVITTLLDQSDTKWPCIEVKPLSREQSLELVEKLTGGQLAPQFSEVIAEHAGGLPVQIVPDAATLAYEQRRGRLEFPRLSLARGAGDSFRAAYDRLDQSSRLLLHAAAVLNPQHIPANELSQHLIEGLGWSKVDVQRTLDTCLDLHLLYGLPDPAMHQLFAAFLRETFQTFEDKATIARVRPFQKKRFVHLANALCVNPADIQTAATLLDYPLALETWTSLGEPPSLEEQDIIGRALSGIGHYDEARTWFEHAVATKQKGDSQGLIDHVSVGDSLQLVGDCLASTGHYDEAQLWFERAVASKEMGDTRGRVDHASVSSSLHQVGDCLANKGHYDDARLWFERAVAEAEKGDLQGRIDHASLGMSLHQVGYCLSIRGSHDEVQLWFERAVAAAEKGDVHGRIDHASLGRSLHQVGYCLSSSGSYDQARPWFERAIAAKEEGDLYGRIDYASLAISLHQVGFCLSSRNQYEEARPWFERAVEAAERGNVHGNIDHESLGRTLYQVGDCLSNMDRYVEALPWFERAVAAKQKGDVHGRVDHASLDMSLLATATCLRNLQRDEQAEQWERRAWATSL